MCLAIPMRIESIDGHAAVASCESNLLAIDVSMLPSLQVGDYVIVHAGFAIARLDRTEAKERIELFRELARSYREEQVGREIH